MESLPKKNSKKNSEKKIVSKIPSSEIVSELGADLRVSEEDVSEVKRICAKIGMSLEDYLVAVKGALSAQKMSVDKYGEEHYEDDHDKRLRAALIGLELEGYIRNKAVSVDSSRHTHVTYAWLNAPIKEVPSVEFRNGN